MRPGSADGLILVVHDGDYDGVVAETDGFAYAAKFAGKRTCNFDRFVAGIFPAIYF